jgi:formylglycine-generating enzyme required for sulfatase activity
MIKVSAPGASGDRYYCIDSTEVTACDYEAFLASSPSTRQIAPCAWNTDYKPDNTNSCLGAYDPANYPSLPMRCVDWCDAVAYCSWAGKELCGSIGGGPRGSLDVADSAWANACSASGRKTYPYGNTQDPAACIVRTTTQPAEVKDVGSTPTCEGGFFDLFDMGGNVAEWENACDGNGGQSQLCEVRGGSFAQVPAAAACDASYSSVSGTRRDLRADDIGFRCCAQTVKPGADSGRDPSAPVPGAFCPGASAVPQGRDGGPLKPRGCPTPAHGSNLVEVPAPPGSPVESYCVDAKEATYADYAAFLASNYFLQLDVCSWDATYVPGCNWPGQAGQEQLPVGCVDWCDAAAFCAWSGKRLCGRVGGGPAPLIQDPNVPRELVNACTKGGTQSYPYGNLYDAQACNGSDADGTPGYQSGSDRPKPVGSMSSCAGPYAGLFDLVGNASEWENGCRGASGADDGCTVRGGGFMDASAYTRCEGLFFTGRNNHVWDIGIRCCTDSL